MTSHCPHCSAKFNVPAELLGKVIKCPGCNNKVKLPDEIEPASTQPKVTSEFKKAALPIQSNSKRLFCPACSSAVNVPPNHTAETINCAQCLHKISLTRKEHEPAKEPVQPKPADDRLYSTVPGTYFEDDEEEVHKAAEIPVNSYAPLFGIFFALAIVAFIWFVTRSTNRVEQQNIEDAAIIANAEGSKANATKGNESGIHSPKNEIGYRFDLKANLSTGEQYLWQGTSVLATEATDQPRLISGVAIPNRLVIIPDGFIEDSNDRFHVFVDNRNYIATVKDRFPEFGFATIQIDRSSAFLAPRVSRESVFENPGDNELRIVFRDNNGKVRVVKNVEVQESNNRFHSIQNPSGLEYATGGVVVNKGGKLVGYVTSASETEAKFVSWNQIIKGGWKTGYGIFDFDTPLPPDVDSQTDQIAKQITPVWVEGTPISDAPDIYQFHTQIASVDVVNGTRFAETELQTKIENHSKNQVRFQRNAQSQFLLDYTDPSIQANRFLLDCQHLPFLLGPPENLLSASPPIANMQSWFDRKEILVDVKNGFRNRDSFGDSPQREEVKFSEENRFRVLTRTEKRIKVERTFSQKPVDAQDDNAVSVSGIDIYELDVATQRIISRKIESTYHQTWDGQNIDVQVVLEIQNATTEEVQNSDVYWRN